MTQPKSIRVVTEGTLSDPKSGVRKTLDKSFPSKRAVVPAIGASTPLVQVMDGRTGDASDGDGLFGTPGTYSIASDKFYDQFRVGAGVTIDVARGVRIFARVIENNGTIRAAKTDGLTATNATGALGGGAPTLGSGSTQLIGASGGNAGGNGTIANGSAGVASAAKTTPGGTGGAGGVGGTSGANTGGASGTSGAKTTPVSGFRTIETAHGAWLTSTISTGIAGGSGGGGAGDGTNAGGGGGGAGSAGGFLFVIAGQLSGSGVFSAPGGNGGNGAAGTAGNAAGGAGGGGGGGGIAIVAAIDSTDWTGTVTALGGTAGVGGAGVGTGTAGGNGTAGAAGVATLLSLSALNNAQRFDSKPKFQQSTTNAAPLMAGATVFTHLTAPVRFFGGPKQVKTYGTTDYYQSGLQTGNNGWNGPSGGGGFWFMEYITDAPVHEVRFRPGNGKVELFVDGKAAVDRTTLTYTDGNAAWYQVSYGKSRRFRHYVWKLNQAPFAGIAIGPTDSLYPPRTKRSAPAYILGDSFTEGAIGLTQGATDHFNSWAYQLCELMGWDHPMVDGEGGTGYINDSGVDAPYKKPYPQRITDDLAPLPANLRPDKVVVAGGYNDPTNTQAEKDAFSAAASLTFSRIATELPDVPVWVVMFVNDGAPSSTLTDRRDLLKAAALAAPNVVAFIDPIAGTWYPGPMCSVPAPDVPGVRWLTGTGNITAPTGAGNADFFRSGDLTHPSAAGHKMLATRSAAAITESLPA